MPKAGCPPVWTIHKENLVSIDQIVIEDVHWRQIETVTHE